MNPDWAAKYRQSSIDYRRETGHLHAEIKRLRADLARTLSALESVIDIFVFGAPLSMTQLDTIATARAVLDDLRGAEHQ